MALEVHKVGHLVLRVRDLDRSLSFYSGLLGLTDVARRDFGEGPMSSCPQGMPTTTSPSSKPVRQPVPVPCTTWR